MATLLGAAARLYLASHPIGGVEVDRLSAVLSGQLVWDPFRPPLFYLLMYLWSPFAATPLLWRLPIVLISLAAVPAVYLFAKALTRDRDAAVWAAVLTALSSFQIEFSHWLTDYPLLGLLFLWNGYCFWRMLEDGAPKRFAVGFVVSHILSLQTHYMALDVLLFQGLFIVWRRGWRGGAGFLKLAALVLVFSPWWLTLWGPMRETHVRPWNLGTGLVVPFTYFSYLAGQSFLLFEKASEIAGHWELWAVSGVFGAIGLRYFLRQRWTEDLRFLAFMLVVSVVGFWLVSFRLPVFGYGLAKYTFPFSLLFNILLVLSIKDLPARPFRWSAAAAYLLVQGISYVHMANQLFQRS